MDFEVYINQWTTEQALNTHKPYCHYCHYCHKQNSVIRIPGLYPNKDTWLCLHCLTQAANKLKEAVVKNKLSETQEGTKDDSDKPRWDLIPPEAMAALVEVFTHGAKKYADRNWEKGMAWSRPYSALMRHLWSFWGGKDKDPESGLLHLAHATWNCLALLQYQIKGVGEDDRV